MSPYQTPGYRGFAYLALWLSHTLLHRLQTMLQQRSFAFFSYFLCHKTYFTLHQVNGMHMQGLYIVLWSPEIRFKIFPDSHRNLDHHQHRLLLVKQPTVTKIPSNSSTTLELSCWQRQRHNLLDDWPLQSIYRLHVPCLKKMSQGFLSRVSMSMHAERDIFLPIPSVCPSVCPLPVLC